MPEPTTIKLASAALRGCELKLQLAQTLLQLLAAALRGCELKQAAVHEAAIKAHQPPCAAAN